MAINSVQIMIVEHSELVKRIKQLNDYVYSKASDEDNKIEFANKCIQLNAMKIYEKALRARLENQDIVCEDGEYFAHLAKPDIHYSVGSNDSKVDCEVKFDDGIITDRVVSK